MNSSVVNDARYRAEIEEIFIDLSSLNIPNPIDWQDLFIAVFQGVTMAQTKQKADIKNALKKFLISQITDLEGQEYLDPIKLRSYTHYKQSLNDTLQDEIRGHQIRTKGQPTYELNEPDISTYSNFEKRCQASTVIYQLADENCMIHEDDKSLLYIAEKYYTKLFMSSKTSAHRQQKLL